MVCTKVRKKKFLFSMSEFALLVVDDPEGAEYTGENNDDDCSVAVSLSARSS